MTPSEESAIILQIVSAHPEGITTQDVVAEFVGNIPPYEKSVQRQRTYKKLAVLEKYGQIEKTILTTGNVWKPK